MSVTRKSHIFLGILTLALSALVATTLPSGALTKEYLASPASVLLPGDHLETLTLRGLTRHYIVHVPTGRFVANRPLILVYHGATASAAYTISITDFEQVANRVGDVVVFMQGYQNTWNELAGHTPAAKAHIDDIGFTLATLTALKSVTRYNVNRVALAGFSNGAEMVETLGCRVAARIHLIVPVEGELNSAVSRSCAPARPLNVYEVHGTADTGIPYGGGTFAGDGGSVTVLSATASAARWATLDGCSPSPRHVSGAGVSLTRYSGCRAGVNVTLRTIMNGTHQWGSNIGVLVASALGH